MEKREADGLYQKAAALFRSGNYHDSLALLKTLEEAYPGNGSVIAAAEKCRERLRLESQTPAAHRGADLNALPPKKRSTAVWLSLAGITIGLIGLAFVGRTLLVDETATLPAATAPPSPSFVQSESPQPRQPDGESASSIALPMELFEEDMGDFDFGQEMTGDISTLCAWFQEFDRANNRVVINGVDISRPNHPYTFEWGDGSTSEGEWPQEHRYARSNRNYIIRITSYRPILGPISFEVTVRFTAPDIRKTRLPRELRVEIPKNNQVKFVSHAPNHDPPEKVDFFGDEFFSVMPRDALEYVLHAAACIQYDTLNRDVVLSDETFHEIMFRDAKFGGMYSLWFTTPVSFAVGDYALAPPVQYSSFFHEMGHNFSLNSPAAFAYGDRTGDASNIYTEALAQILQHVTAYMLINNRNSLGLDDFTAKEIALNALSSMRTLRKSHEDWLAAGMKFSSWNDPATPEDDTVGPFMTVAYTFLKHAFNRQTGYRLPLRRMMRLLQCFNPDWYARYAQSGNSPDAEQFRATLMVAAVSYGLSSDLRDEFKAMHFPIGDDIYTEMLRAAETR